MNNSFKLIEESTLVLKTEKKTTERDLFDRELLPVWLNYANGVTDLNQEVDTDGDKIPDSTFSEIIYAAEKFV